MKGFEAGILHEGQSSFFMKMGNGSENAYVLLPHPNEQKVQ